MPGESLNNYDYAGQDPINGYDLNGTFCSPEEFQNWLAEGTPGSDCGTLAGDYEACIKSHDNDVTTDADPTHGCYAVVAAKYKKRTGHSPIRPPASDPSFWSIANAACGISAAVEGIGAAKDSSAL